MDGGRVQWISLALLPLVVWSATAGAVEGPCGSQAWSHTKCCNEEKEVGAVSEEVLSVAECGAVDNETSFVELEWRHSTLQEEGYSLRRIFLFSHCINPTNTSSAPSMSTLLNRSDRTHRTSSTTVYYPAASACAYFGCYEANVGENLYTFEEVSCISSSISSITSSLAASVSTSVPYYVVEATAEAELVPLTPVASLPRFTPSPSTLWSLASQISARSTAQRLRATSSSSNQAIFVTLPSPSLNRDTAAGPPVLLGLWPWFVALLVVPAIIAATSLSLLAWRTCFRRDFVKDMMYISRNADFWTSTSDVKYGSLTTLKDLDLHSVHTEYDCIVNDEKLKKECHGELSAVQRPSPPLPTSAAEEVLDTEPLESVTDSGHHSQSSSGIDTSFPSNSSSKNTSSDFTSGTSSSSSYVTYGSLYTLLPEHTRSQATSREHQTAS